MAFSAEWLALREAADAAARSATLTARLARTLPSVHELRILDLGTGTGSNMRYLADRLETPRQDWLLVDYDARLLDACRKQIGAWAIDAGGHIRAYEHGFVAQTRALTCQVATETVDLGRLDLLGNSCAGRHLVTASALLDLVSVPWLHAVAAACRDARASVLFALIYDGRIVCEPAEPGDETIKTLVNEHQRTDKGFGAAAGPEATSVARACLEEAGYDVHDEPADWVLPPASASLQRALIEGWADAARAIEPGRADEIRAWSDRRLQHIGAGRSSIVVGHRDLVATVRSEPSEARSTK